ncbi:hypothetical protein FQN57_003139 [Myotisia sp. PD_48]|nr:hypothetical protein FQN57_003139 [Myotisia sp. PD_48]
MDLSQLVSNYEPTTRQHPVKAATLQRPGRMIPSLSLSRKRSLDAAITPLPSPYPPSYLSQLPLSPPEEMPSSKFSLPSISTLLQNIESHPTKRPRSDDWDSKSAQNSPQSVKKRMIFPPTPPLRPGSTFEGARYHHHSPSASSASSPHSSISLPSLTRSSSATASPITEVAPERRVSRISLASLSNYSQTSRISSPCEARYPSPAHSNPQRFGSPIEPSQSTNSSDAYLSHSSRSGSYPAPGPIPVSAVAPITVPAASSTAATSVVGSGATQHHHHQMVSLGSPAWQHHHYFPPSNTATFPLNHDRYICRTCHKAFSRPSSLRIHSHSHTGEKPFRCPHVGCGKAFSVRSNMKRHERGCHSGRAGQQALVS